MKKTKTTKRAFTLVELLAVIVILAIILVIAVPQIMDTIEKSKKGSMESSAKLVASTVETKYQAANAVGDEFNLSGDCMSMGNLDTDEYTSCTYTIDTNGKAKVTLIGKTGGKFANYKITDATKVSATCNEITTYTITLDANGGTVSTSSLSVNSGSAYGTLLTPTYTGKYFAGWYTGETDGTKVESTDIPTEDGTIYAHWANSQFEADSWATIKTNVHNGTTTAYHVGDTKCIALDGFTTTNDNGCSNGEFKVRIANMSTPTECSTEGFSQTACGFVVEFTDIIIKHAMNSTATNVGGYPASLIYSYIKDTIYPAIKAVTGDIIVDTTVVSGHGGTVNESNYTTTDKVYLLSTHEIWTDGTSNVVSSSDTAYNNTRQLDYYANNSVTTRNYSGAIKKYNGNVHNWWLRAADSNYTNYFLVANGGGNWSNFGAGTAQGVSPAFRIA